jgi:hypothetical protein
MRRNMTHARTLVRATVKIATIHFLTVDLGYRVGERAEIFARCKLIKVAVAVRPERLDPQRFGEMAMRNRGVNARVFTSVEDAEEWLLE